MKPKRMVRIVPASQVKNNFGEVIKRVYEKEETQIIERAGLPVAAIITMNDLERLYPKRIRELPQIAVGARRQRAWRQLTAVMDEIQEGSERFSEEKVEADAQKAVNGVRHGSSKK